MMEQYRSIKQAHTDAILFFRLGDFYEMFHQDAREASSLLGLTLTKRNGIPMCGIPYHAAHAYLARLLRHGKKIAICEQTRMPEDGKGIAEREVVEVITPGTVVDEDFLDRTANNYLFAVGRMKDTVSEAYLDLSTGEFRAGTFPWSERRERLRKELARLRPREILVQESILEDDPDLDRMFREREGLTVNRYPDWSFDLRESEEKLARLFDTRNLKAFGIEEGEPAVLSCGVLLSYVEDTSRSLLPHVRSILLHDDRETVGIDESTQKNLELVQNLQDGSRRYTLLEVLDGTRCAMGSRTMRRWILNPLRDREQILQRQEGTERLYRNQMLLSALREELGRILDLERLSARVALDKAHAKDLLSLAGSIDGVLRIRELLTEWGQDAFGNLPEDIFPALREIHGLLSAAIRDEPSTLLSEGNLIRDGYHADLDELRLTRRDGRKILDEYLREEREATGISSLKVRYNRIIGHYLEVTKSNLHLVPDRFVRRQSLVGGERYVTDRLIEIETRIESATDRIVELERELFLAVRERVKQTVPAVLQAASAIADLDCLAAFAWAATRHGYAKPSIIERGKTRIREGRHPVVEAHLPPGEFVPNGIDLDPDDKPFALITGPNMAGKSTFLRQTALIVLMAQIGSFVPAGEATVALADNIFCRVGASDNLARGESTFLVEMNETAYILRMATGRSLIIMDEVGRGTGTQDGLSIAWAVSEYLLDRLGARTLFATHFHELTRIDHGRLQNLSMEVSEREGEVIFLKRVRPGSADHSYGIHVARLAGIPDEVILRAYEILQQLGPDGEALPAPPKAARRDAPRQDLLFAREDMLLKELENVRIEGTTPLEALNLIARWRKEFL